MNGLGQPRSSRSNRVRLDNFDRLLRSASQNRFGCCGLRRGGIGWGRRSLGKAVEKSLCCQTAGNLASRGASHAVAHHEGPMLGQRGAGVLVGAAHPAAMREHGEGACGRRGWGLRRCRGRDLRLRGVHSCSICHCTVPDHRKLGPSKRYSLPRWNRKPSPPVHWCYLRLAKRRSGYSGVATKGAD